jgi:hypothetical protein
MRLGPGAYGKAALPVRERLARGRYVVWAQVRSNNTHGPGGRIELFSTEAKSGKILKRETHFLGNGSFDWKRIGFATEIPSGATGLAVAFGNGGTGEFLVTEVEFQHLKDGTALPSGVLEKANSVEPKGKPAPTGAIADYRMKEGQGLHVYDDARGPLGMLELANMEWLTSEGRPALKFTDTRKGRLEFPRAGSLERNYFSHLAYEKVKTVPVAIAGNHGGGFQVKAFTILTSIKPERTMPGGRADVVGLGARRFILHLQGRKAPYRLAATLNVNDSFVADATLQADRWSHLALTGKPTADKKWQVRLYLDGKLVKEGVTQKFAAPATIPPSLILGAELFYLHSSYYRGLIGRTTLFDRTLTDEQVAAMARDNAGREQSDRSRQ